MSSKRRYKAFISYSHNDERHAQRLFRRLEGYRPPRRNGDPRPERLAPVFLDTAEFPAAPDLPDRIQVALAGADALIVLCSPAAAQSHWVCLEIETFRALNPTKPVLCVLLDGEPNAANPALECLPAPLRQGPDPLAADFRTPGAKRRLAFKKIVAGLTEMDLAELVQRDAQRKFRNVMAVTGLATLMVITFAYLAVVASVARNDARRGQERAERLIEFMISDLRQRLDEAGRLDILKGVGRVTENYYSSQSAKRLSPEQVGRWSRTDHLNGEILIEGGDVDEAEAPLLAAYERTARVLAQEPNKADQIWAHAQSTFWLGEQAFRGNAYAEAEDFWNEYNALADQLIALEPKNSKYLVEQAHARLNRGAVLLSSGQDPLKALAAFQSALEGHQAAWAITGPSREARIDIANTHAWIARAFVAAQGLADAEDHRRRQLQILAPLNAKADIDYRALYEELKSRIELRRIRELRGTETDAETVFRNNLRIARQLIFHEPLNFYWNRMGLGELTDFIDHYWASGILADKLSYFEAYNPIIDAWMTFQKDTDAWTLLNLQVASAQLQFAQGRDAKSGAYLNDVLTTWSTRAPSPDGLVRMVRAAEVAKLVSRNLGDPALYDRYARILDHHADALTDALDVRDQTRLQRAAQDITVSVTP
ncbi:MAG: toll/interleukin-1 receptor domain-containing protein [Maricaulaceae bacterium]